MVLSCLRDYLESGTDIAVGIVGIPVAVDVHAVAVAVNAKRLTLAN